MFSEDDEISMIVDGHTSEEDYYHGGEVCQLRERVRRLESEINEARNVLADHLDRDKDPSDTLHVLATIALNGIYWRDKKIKGLEDQLATVREERDEFARKVALSVLNLNDLAPPLSSDEERMRLVDSTLNLVKSLDLPTAKEADRGERPS